MKCKLPDLSIIIATYNRAELLSKTLESIVNNCGCSSNLEIIVVDNCCTDNTQDIVKYYAQKNNQIKLVYERKQGLSYARNRGIDEAIGEILVFLDDDVEIDKAWLDSIVKPFCNADVWCVGGRVLPFEKNSVPSWLPAKLRFLLSLHDYGSNEKIMSSKEKPMGCNMAFRKKVFEKAGRFDPHLGRRGARLLGGEEVLLYYKIRDLHKKAIYSPNALVYHKVGSKLTKEYVLNYAYWLGVSESYIERTYQKTRFILKMARSLVYLLFYPGRMCLQMVTKLPESDDVLKRYMLRYSLGYLSYRRRDETSSAIS